MKTIRLCPGCGEPLPTDAPLGLCPRCLMQSGTSPTAERAATAAAASPAPPAPIPGQRFGGYHILRLLGRGGMGEVYEAEQVETGRRVALKVMGHALGSEPDRRRFLREGRLAAAVNHPNVVYIHGSEEIDGAPVIAMELIQGGTLKDQLKQAGPLAPAEAAETALQIIAGLEAAGKAGVLHRDIKPANCYVDADGTIKVGDFGLSVSTLARGESLLTATGSVVGTPAYASPEQLRGEALDVTSDIYSTGATLYHLLTGRTPFGATDFVKLITEVLDKQPPAPHEVRSEVPVELSRVVMRCLAKERRARFQSYEQLREALLPFRAAEPVAAPPARRSLAGFLDYLVGSAPSLVFFAYWGVDPLDHLIQERTLHAALMWLPFFLWYFLYLALAEGRSGAALGKLICGLRVVGPDGAAPGFARAGWRTAIFMAPVTLAALGFIAFASWSKMNAARIQNETVTTWIALLLLALLFVTMRRRNGYAAVQDLWTGTRVILAPKSQPRPALPPLPLALASVQALPEPVGNAGGAGSAWGSFGPYQVQGSLWKTETEQLLEAFDPALRRRIWIHVRPATADPVGAPRRDLNRPGRLRWLNGGCREDRLWDAYQACDGAPFLSLREPAQPWAGVRFWLLDLAEEMGAALEQGVAAPTLALDRVWVTANGRALFLDFPWPGLSDEVSPATPLPLTGVTEMQRFLELVARAGLEVRGAEALEAPAARRPRPSETGGLQEVFSGFRTAVPLHAHGFLSSLAHGTFAQPEFIVGNLRSLVTKPGRVTRAWRGASVAMVPLLLLGFACLIVITVNFEFLRWQRQWTRLYPGQPSLLAAAQLYEDQLMHQTGGSNKKTGERNLELMRAYLAHHFGPILTNDTFWTNRALTELLDEAELRQAVTNYPAPTPDMIRRAETGVAPRVQQRQGSPTTVLAVGVLLSGGVAFALVELLGCTFFGQSPILRLFGIAVVSRQGWPATRARLLWRWTLVWVPLGALALTVVILMIHENLRQGGLPLEAAPQGLASVSTRLALAAGALALLGGLLYAARHPERALADRVAGTSLVPR